MNENPIPLSSCPIGIDERWADISEILDRLALEAEQVLFPIRRAGYACSDSILKASAAPSPAP